MSGDIPGIVIVGPTASGKSRLALELAPLFNGEIVSCDALQIYQGMDIGTAKVPKSDQAMVPHHMIDVQSPDRDFSAGDYQRMARNVICGIHERGHVPFVVGGTGFYLRALIDGLFEGPSRSEELRARMRNILHRKGSAFLHKRLERVDPFSAARISAADRERIVRAYEVFLLTGKSMEWWQQQPRDAFHGYRWLKLGINVPRDRLYDRINRRVHEMFENGLIEETQRLLAQFPGDAHAFKAIGYKQAIDHLENRISLAEAIADTQLQSRHYAKRQLTWFRADKSTLWLEGTEKLEELTNRAAAMIRQFLENTGTVTEIPRIP
jgi:tRNA dimethylallyltransferase